MGGVLPYKWEAYCRTNGRRIEGFPFFEASKPGKHGDANGGRTAVQIGGVLPYFLDKLWGLGFPKHSPKTTILPHCPLGTDFCCWDSQPLFALKTGMPHEALECPEGPSTPFCLLVGECSHKANPTRKEFGRVAPRTEIGEPK